MSVLDIEYVGAGVTVPVWNRMACPPDDWTTVTFDQDNADPAHHHQDLGGPSFVNGPALIVGALYMRLEGMPTSQVQVRPYRIAADGSGTRVWTGRALTELVTDVDHQPAVTHVAVPLAQRVPAGQRLRVELMQAHDSYDFPAGSIAWAQIVGEVTAL